MNLTFPMTSHRVVHWLLLVLAATASSVRTFSQRHRLDDFRGHQHHIQFDPTIAAGQGDAAAVTEHNYTRAVVDHYAPVSAVQYWNQRYFVNDEFWAGEGFPVFLYIGGEGPLTASTLTKKNYIHELAQQHRAHLVAVEHRYYGTSYPTPDMSNENLRYLSSQQALFDLARIHTYLTSTYGLKRSKWVAFGGSYPGALAAWFKLKYPHLVEGSVASSAPLYAKENFAEYMEVVGSGLRYFGGGACYRAVEKAIQALHALVIDTSASAQATLSSLFNPCAPMHNEFDASLDHGTLPRRFSIQSTLWRTLTLSDVCGIFASENTPPLTQLQTFVKAQSKKSCLDSTFQGSPNGTVEVLSQTAFDGQSSSRQWFYQTCNEFGYFQTTTSSASPFAALATQSLQNVLELCKRVFNIKVDPDTDRTNVYYGSLGITVDNVVFSSGTIDPWHALAVQNSTKLATSSSHPIFIEGTAHCADMHARNSTTDSGHLVWARKQIAAAVASYVSPTATQ
ncbi:Thymus-specific serine protease [Aphanomyces cochlioides]|nr:Thymus-specific serine protease [Aphanomyces cochlioides]